MNFSPHQMLFDQIKEDEMSWAYGICGGENKCVQGFHWEI